ncbi:hypothetical protein LSM04_002498 [Trypanosoma melophagium]|uniref:uncharacterized protein n=1 Tax=Trypanosoma melophagium TaxID=715481 RepID=UPI00351A3F5B|nr:hypothetical protein LSM04_002498 [Trypanosoma melophagium]
MTEEPMSSSKRIQLLRERLEMYNATIAEAMGVVAGVTSMERTAAPTSKTTAREYGNERERESKNKESAPRLERDLAAEFSAARGFSGGSRRFEKRTVPPPPSPPEGDVKSTEKTTTTKLTGVAATTLASSSSANSSSELDSAVFSDSDDGPFVNPYLNEQVLQGDGAILGSEAERSKEEENIRAATSRVLDNSRKIINPHISSSGSSIAEDSISPNPSSALVFQKQQKKREEKEEKEEDSREEKNVDEESKEEKTHLETKIPFASLETAYYRLTLAEQALQKLTSALDIESFPRSLPQKKHSQQLADDRDGLLRREQELRRRGTGGLNLNTIYETSAMDVAQQVRQLLADCGAAQSLFARVHERRAAVAAKEELLQRRLGELEARQRETAERRQTLATLQRRTEQREAQLQQREENYRRELDAHKAREEALQARLTEVEALGRRAASWMKILDERDATTAAKERRLRRVQADLVRRSEELLCCRNARNAKYTQNQSPQQQQEQQQQTRVPPRQVSSP